MILLRGAQIVRFGSLSGDEWDIVVQESAFRRAVSVGSPRCGS
jgi:hypothetical protein